MDLEKIRDVVWQAMPDKFQISDVVNCIKEHHQVEVCGQLVRSYLSRLDRAGIILAQDFYWIKNNPY